MNLTCDTYRALLDRLLDGETLTGAEAEAMRAHEAACPDCALLRDALTAQADDLAALAEDTPPMPEDLHAAWMAAVEADAAARDDAGEDTDRQSGGGEDTDRRSIPHRKAWQRWLAVAAMVALVIGGTLLTRDELPRRQALRAARAPWATAAVSAAQEEPAQNDSGAAPAAALTAAPTSMPETPMPSALAAGKAEPRAEAAELEEANEEPEAEEVWEADDEALWLNAVVCDAPADSAPDEAVSPAEEAPEEAPAAEMAVVEEAAEDEPAEEAAAEDEPAAEPTAEETTEDSDTGSTIPAETFADFLVDLRDFILRWKWVFAGAAAGALIGLLLRRRKH